MLEKIKKLLGIDTPPVWFTREVIVEKLASGVSKARELESAELDKMASQK